MKLNRVVRRSSESRQIAPASGALAKIDPCKVALEALLRERTSVGNGWISTRQAMGHPGSVSRMLGACKSDPDIASIRGELAKEFDQ
jgi:hypothetical protein